MRPEQFEEVVFYDEEPDTRLSEYFMLGLYSVGCPSAQRFL